VGPGGSGYVAVDVAVVVVADVVVIGVSVGTGVAELDSVMVGGSPTRMQ
jgi:hypothetical protein